MIRILKTITATLPAAIFIMAAGTARGQTPTTPVMSVSPTSSAIQADGSSTVPLVWSSTTFPGSVASDSGRYLTPDGRKIGTNRTNLQSTAGCRGGCSMPESLRVPVSIIEEAGKLGFQQIRYLRTWDYRDLKGAIVDRQTVDTDLFISGAPREITVSPSKAGVGFGLDTNMNLRWTVQLSPTDGNVLVRSLEGVFMEKRDRSFGPPVKKVLQKKDSDKVIFQEQLTVPSEVVEEAVRRNLETFRYVRTFTVGSASLQGELLLKIGSGVDSVKVSPARARATLGKDSVARVTWTVGARPDGGATKSLRSKAVPSGGLNVVSGEGVFHTVAGELLGKEGSDLSLTLTGPSGSVAERVRIPGDVVRKAARLGQNRFLYTRTFSDGYGTASGDLTIDLSGRIGGEFSIDRVSLTFSDDSLVKVLSPGEKERAVATITYTGAGLFVARWQIAKPTSTAGKLTFISKGYVNRYLSGASGAFSKVGGHQVKIKSPVLDTSMSGPYGIRLVITVPDVGGQAVTLLYQVNPPNVGVIPMGPGAVPEIDVLRPRGGVAVRPGTAFAWEDVAGSVAYRLEFFDGPKVLTASRVSGQMVSAGATELTLTQMTVDNLNPGMNYWWRVVALGPGGGILGASSMAPIQTP